MLLLDGELAAAEPKKLRYRLLHTAAPITRTARQTRLRIAEHWPWATNLVTAYHRLPPPGRVTTTHHVSPVPRPDEQPRRNPATRRATVMPTPQPTLQRRSTWHS
jgi:hypothetical protein